MAENQAATAERQIVIFDLNGESYGVDIGAVREIIRMQEITRVPHAPRFVAGVINLRGKVVPVVDLRTRFSMPAGEDDVERRIVVMDVLGQDIGVVVDAVTEVSRVPQASIEPPLAVVTAESSGYVAGIVKTDKKLIILLDIEKVISIDEAGHVTETAAAESGEAAA